MSEGVGSFLVRTFDVETQESGIFIEDLYVGSRTAVVFPFEKYGIDKQIALAYAKSVCAHIRYVRAAGEDLGVDRAQLEQHDLSKFTIEEFPHYARQFFGDGGNPAGFAGAWLHHIHSSPHHWQHWMFADGYNIPAGNIENGCLPMPEEYVLEMIADWMGASRSYTGVWDMADWLRANLPKIRVHSKTADLIRVYLHDLGYQIDF